MRKHRSTRPGLVATLLVGPCLAIGGPASPGDVAPRKAPPAYLIYLHDGRDPIVVKRYVEEGDEIRFQKFGGWVGIPRYEILRIVPDDPDAAPPLPPAPTADPVPPDAAGEAVARVAPGEGDLFVTIRDGGQVKARSVAAEGDRIRVNVPDGSFTIPRADLVGIVRVPAGPGVPEAWLALTATPDRVADGVPGESRPGAAPGTRQAGREDLARAPAATPPPGPAGLPYPASDRPHLLRLASGQVMRVDGFWVEDGEVRFRRFGGMIGIALAEVLRLIPEEVPPIHARTPVRFVQQLGPDLLEVRVRSGLQRVRLIGVEPVAQARTAEDPWARIEPGLVLDLEFDRLRFGDRGEWLAYAFLPGGRMLNAELIRLGLARPRSDGKNLRYLDLFEELAGFSAPGPSGRAAAGP